MILYDDNYFMRRAIEEAKIALQKNEVPVGAVIVSDNQIIAQSRRSMFLLNYVPSQLFGCH